MGRRACRAGLLLWRLRLTPLPYRLRRGGGVAPAGMPVATVGCLSGSTTSTYRRETTTIIMGNYLGKLTRSLRQHEWRPSYTHSAAPVLGPRAATPGVAANPGPSVDVSYCELCSADGSSPWS